MDAYIFQADIYCHDCAAEIQAPHDSDRDSDEAVCGPYPDGGGEADAPQCCGSCFKFLENPLTADGVEYVRAALKAGDGDPEVLAEWRKFYDYIELGDDSEDEND